MGKQAIVTLLPARDSDEETAPVERVMEPGPSLLIQMRDACGVEAGFTCIGMAGGQDSIRFKARDKETASEP